MRISDWSSDVCSSDLPLSEAQCRYAADDVRHLHALHADLSQRLDALQRTEWLAQECARQIASERDQHPERWLHLGLRSAQGLPTDSQWRLCRLLQWRAEQARASARRLEDSRVGNECGGACRYGWAAES